MCWRHHIRCCWQHRCSQSAIARVRTLPTFGDPTWDPPNIVHWSINSLQLGPYRLFNPDCAPGRQHNYTVLSAQRSGGSRLISFLSILMSWRAFDNYCFIYRRLPSSSPSIFYPILCPDSNEELNDNNCMNRLGIKPFRVSKNVRRWFWICKSFKSLEVV